MSGGESGRAERGTLLTVDPGLLGFVELHETVADFRCYNPSCVENLFAGADARRTASQLYVFYLIR